jgi:SAM-dependent methyltransferase
LDLFFTILAEGGLIVGGNLLFFRVHLIIIGMTTTLAELSCPYCRARAFAPWYSGIEDRLKHAAGQYAFARCGQCGSALQVPIPKPEQLASFYPKNYGYVPPPPVASGIKGLLASLPHRLFYDPIYQSQMRQVLRGIGWRPDQQGLHLLDVGCGRGLRLLGFRERGFRITATDFAEEYLTTVREMGFNAFASDFEHLAEHVSPESVDVITAFHVFEHVPDLELAAKTSWQILRPGGWLVVIVPLADSIQAKYLKERWIGFTEAPRHLTVPSQAGMRQLLIRTGFRIERELPDALMSNAGMWALSLFPWLAFTHRKPSKLRQIITSGLGFLTTLAATPLTIVEHLFSKKPAAGMFFARKAG